MLERDYHRVTILGSYILMSNVVAKDEEKRITLAWRFEMCLYTNRRYNKAKILFVEVIQMRQRVLGAEYPDMLTSIANLASTYQNQGHQKEAKDLLVQVIETRKRVLGAEHPSMLTSIANLALTFWN